MANAIVQEVLAFVRRFGCRSIAPRSPLRCASAVSLADGKAQRGSILSIVALPRGSTAARRRTSTS